MHDFTQYGFSEEACAAANEILDFRACIRADGSVYGTAGQCRIGTETQKKVNEPLRAYVKLMKGAKERGKPEDTSDYHSHHAFPRSIFTNEETANKKQVWLTFREHFEAHQLLHKALENRYGEHDIRTIKMGHAIAMMANGKGGEKLTKEQYAEAMATGSQAMKNFWNLPGMREKKAEQQRQAMKDPERLAKAKETLLRYDSKNWNDPEYRKKQLNALAKQWETAERRLKQAKVMADNNKRLWADPKQRARWEEQQRIRQTAAMQNPELRKQVGEGKKKWYEDNPGKRAEQGARMKEIMAKPEVKEKVKNAVGNRMRGAKHYHRINEDGTVDRIRTKEDPGPGWTPKRYYTPEEKEARLRKLAETNERKKREKEQNG